MSSPSSENPAQLVTLIEAAKGEAVRLGAKSAPVVSHLDAALAAARATTAPADRPDEGLRPEELTTGNDQ